MNRSARCKAVGAAALLVIAGAAAVLAQGANPPGRGEGGARAAREPDVEVGVLTCNLQAQSAEPDIAAPGDGQPRVVLCSFKPGVGTAGTEETYTGSISGIALQGQTAAAIAWVVTATSTAVTPGMLHQSYNSDQTVPADQPTRLIGEINPGIVLRPLADKPEGSASAKEKPKPTGFIVLGLELKLDSATA